MYSQREFNVPEVIPVNTAVVTQFCKVWVSVSTVRLKNLYEFCEYS